MGLENVNLELGFVLVNFKKLYAFRLPAVSVFYAGDERKRDYANGKKMKKMGSHPTCREMKNCPFF